jgi:integrase
MYTYWSDVNLAHATVRVSHKPDRGWTPKAYKEREIPIPAKLAKSLKAWKAKADKTCGLVFPTTGCKPKLDFLDCLKNVAERAKLEEDTSGFTSSVQRLRTVSLGRCRSPHGSAVAWSLGYGIDHAVFEAVTQPARAG